ncbi:MAG: hypothetical protein ACI9OJ_002669, partial [Myxococcota bacterium]
VTQGALCLPNLEPANECSLSAQCGAGRICLNATCVTTCDVSTDCTAGNFCGPNSLCVLDDRPILQCLVNSDCADSCVDGRCVATCQAGVVPSTCGENNLCTPYGFCNPTVSCFEKSDCSSTFDCINGRCDSITGAPAPVDEPAPDANPAQ